ncbi:hypothetical protein ColLi_10007 [Colletotrichum liriopes]|uniref:Uncharacterized protein n=1 Tax=Colletotrichum liriopes TaxID=708192 RepID=A0AA37GUP7_9PEZI|nr:hypothetical protein ColLi_10007 [Colletotrichum liriopes]
MELKDRENEKGSHMTYIMLLEAFCQKFGRSDTESLYRISNPLILIVLRSACQYRPHECEIAF